MEGRGKADVAAVAALDDAHRSTLYDLARAARRPITREDAAQSLGISRKLAAFHLDKLVAAGLLEVTGQPADVPRSVGRTPKRYRPADATVVVSLPGRGYRELATVLVQAIVEERPDETAAEARLRVAHARGRAHGETIDRESTLRASRARGTFAQAEVALERAGFEPYRVRAGCLRLANCPFHPIAETAPALVCGINEAYLDGMLGGLGAGSLVARLRPAPGECCVEICEPGVATDTDGDG